MLKTYFKVVLLVLFLVGSFGLILPYLFSAVSSELVMLGVVYAILAIPATCYLVKSIFIKSKGEKV